jgi:uncharacterized protein YqjF (DUF2071 family)
MPYPKHAKTRRPTGFWKVSLKLDIFPVGWTKMVIGMWPSLPRLISHPLPGYAAADFQPGRLAVSIFTFTFPLVPLLLLQVISTAQTQ